jgi:phenylalanyl-tRNA synthetase alpha chain
MTITMTTDELARALALRDLSDPAAGEHVVAAIEQAAATAWRIPVHRETGPRIVSIADNYDRLLYHPDAITRDRRYSRYLGSGWMLRSHTTAAIPRLLDRIADGWPSDVVWSVPGICYRRDAIDRTHTGEPHQLDLWRIRRGGAPLTKADLTDLIALAVGAVLPGRTWRTPPSPHPYTTAGREIYVHDGGREVEIGECGLAHPALLAAAGLPAGATGLAMGLGLDRLVMLAKGLPDIRLLRATDPRIADRLRDLTPYRPVSTMPAISRDLSLAVAADLDAELLGDRVRELLGDAAQAVQEVAVLAETGYDQLLEPARRRLGARLGQKNVLLRIVLCRMERTLTSTEANAIRDRIYARLHEGDMFEWVGQTTAQPATGARSTRLR